MSFLSSVVSFFTESSPKTFSEAAEGLITKSGAKVIEKIYQGKSKGLKEAAKELDPQWINGVCHGMVLYYIGSQFRGTAGKSEFHEMAQAGKFTTFGLVQDELKLSKNQIAHQFDAFREERQKERDGIQGQLDALDPIKSKGMSDFLGSGSSITSSSSLSKRPSLSASASSSSSTSAVEKALIEKRDQIDSLLDKESDRVKKELDNCEAGFVYNSSQPENLDRREDVFSNISLSNLVPNLRSGLNHPGYYMLKLSGADHTGHAIGFVHTKETCRMMDPNSCEVEFTGLTAMLAFCTDYFPVYNSDLGASLKNGNCTLIRFS